MVKSRTPRPPRRNGRSLRGHVAPDGIETFYAVRSHDSSLSPDEFIRLPRRPIHVVLDNLRSAFNVGSIFRLADAVRAAGVICCGYTCHPPHGKLEQTAMGTSKSVPWRHVADTVEAIRELSAAGVQTVAIETVERAEPFHRFDFRLPTALVLGNEALGVSRPVLSLCDTVVEIPVFGFKNSINVAAAAAIVIYEVARRAGWLDEDVNRRVDTWGCTS